MVLRKYSNKGFCCRRRGFFTLEFFLLLLFVFLIFPSKVSAGICDPYLNCNDCVTLGQSKNCVWEFINNSCLNWDEMVRWGFNTSNMTRSCGGGTSSSQTTTASCSKYSSCSECLKHINDLSCIWSICTNKCQTHDEWIKSGGSCGADLPTKCGDSSSAPATVPTVRVIPISTPKPTLTPVPKKENGQECQSDTHCLSGNCTNYVCCIESKICCSQSNFCPTDQYCSTNDDRYYCLPRWDNGVSCTANDQCKSKNCGKGICCGGQPCCKTDGDCGKDEYCETKDNLYYCRTKWNGGEYCEKPSACRSGYCDTYTQKCAENPKDVTSTPKKVRCGDGSCDDWLGENCCNCAKDCASVADFCCAQNSKFARPKDRQNTIFYLYPAPGGSIPNGRLVVPKNMDEKAYFGEYQPKICRDGKIVEGECFESDHCAEGICVEGKCTTASSDEPQEVKDEKVAQEIYNNQTNYLKEDVWVNVYDKIKGKIISSTRVEGNLEISLEVQGATVGETLEVKVGNSIRSWLKVVNNTNYSVAVVAGIVYPGQLTNSFKLEETEYDLSCSRNDGKNPLVSFIGSANAARLGGQYFILPSDHRLIIHSDVTPQQEGYLDVQGLVYYSKEKMYANSSLVQAKIAPVNFENSFQKAEVSESVSVTKKDCNWLYCY